MRGLVNTIYTFGLITMLFISIYYMVPSLFGEGQQTSVGKIVNDVTFTLRDSLELASLYFENAGRLSVLQAAYENGLNGGLMNAEPHDMITHEGEEYVLWYNNGDISPDRETIIRSINENVNEKFSRYTAGYGIKAIMDVKIPEFGSPVVTDTNGYSLRLKIPGNERLFIASTTAEGEEITIGKSSDVNTVIDVPYFQLFTEAKEIHSNAISRLSECGEQLEGESGSFCCKFRTEILEDGDECIVKIEASTRKNFMIWNGEETSLEPIKLVFVERATEQQTTQTETTSQEETQTEEMTKEEQIFPLYSDIDNKFDLNPEDYVLIVEGDAQKMYLVTSNEDSITIHNTYDISTGEAGFGNQVDSYKTPLGIHIIKEKYGDGAPLGEIFVARVDTGEVATIYTEPIDTDEDHVTTRILRLDGLESTNTNSYERLIYIHGTPEEGLIGTPASNGCIRMKNSEIAELYDLVGIEVYVNIADNLA